MPGWWKPRKTCMRGIIPCGFVRRLSPRPGAGGGRSARATRRACAPPSRHCRRTRPARARRSGARSRAAWPAAVPGRVPDAAARRRPAPQACSSRLPSRVRHSQRTHSVRPLGRCMVCGSARVDMAASVVSGTPKLSSTQGAPRCPSGAVRPSSRAAAPLSQSMRPSPVMPTSAAIGVSSSAGVICRRTTRCSVDCAHSSRFSISAA